MIAANATRLPAGWSRGFEAGGPQTLVKRPLGRPAFLTLAAVWLFVSISAEAASRPLTAPPGR